MQTFAKILLVIKTFWKNFVTKFYESYNNKC